MTLYIFTTQEKLEALEQIIESFRRTATSENDYRTLRLYRSIAADVRGRLDGVPGVALSELDRRITFAHRSKTRLGYDRDHLVGVAEELIGRWPTVKQALELFGGEDGKH